MEVCVGQKWLSDVGGRFTVVAVDDRFVYVKLTKSPKRMLANPAGGYPTTRTEMGEWTLLEEVAVMREP